MSNLGELYQELIIDHSQSPRNFRKLEGADRSAAGNNPLCGDKYTVYLKLDHGVINEISFEGSGCAISKASASMMTASVKEKTKEQAEAIFKNFHRMVTGNGGGEVDRDALGKLAVFAGVSEYPVRVKCATLAWHTLQAALEGKGETTL